MKNVALGKATRVKPLFIWFLIGFISLLLLAPGLYAQNGSGLQYKPLQSMPGDEVVLDEVTGNYLFYRSGERAYGRPYKVLSKDEYQDHLLNNSLRNYWVQKRNETSNATGERRGSLIRPIRVDDPTFIKIFGSSDITITPQGSAELIFGLKSTTTDNPAIPKSYRTTTVFDFDTKFMFNVTGSIGDRVSMRFNYDSDATFTFDSEMKLAYQGGEDDIIQKIEVGNVSMPLGGTLITGSQALTGLRTDLKFGKLTMSAIASRQKSESQVVEIKGGMQAHLFDVAVDEYDANRHFFLAQYFEENYDRFLSNLPLILSGLNITKIEVWVTNKTNRFENSRNIVAFMDLAENKPYSPVFSPKTGGYPTNESNNLWDILPINSLRSMDQVTSILNGFSLNGGRDYEKLERARKLLPTEFTLNAELGYISLASALTNDEVLAVAFEFTANGRTYKVGDLSTDGINAPDALMVKLLRGTNFNPQLPTWRLMMKNIYSVDAYSMSKNNFELNVLYNDPAVGTDVPYIAEGAIANIPLLRALGLDELNGQLDPYPDGMFDFISGVTVNADRGLVIFPVTQPFGSHLRKKINNPAIADKYVFQDLYDSTLVKAREKAELNRYKLSGSYQTEGSGSEIRLNASNLPEGSVVVTAGGVKLVEGVDYQVNYVAGIVTITNAGYLNSSTPIRVTLESRDAFSLKTRTLLGAHLNYQFNEKFNIGGTILNLTEKPLTQKVGYGDESISNTIWGLNTSYRSESRFITNLVDKIPLIQTKERSSFSFDGEFAQFIPGYARGISGTSFIDDFEGAKTSLDLSSYLGWTLASIPGGQPDIFPDGSLPNYDLKSGFNRSKLAWYTIYPEFLRNSSNTPGYMRANPAKYQENHFVREIPINEIFPERQMISGTPPNLTVFNMAYYPKERGPYNFDPNLNSNGLLPNPENRWAGIQRSLSVTDFETANYEYIEFWLMDPFVYNPSAKGGDFYINLGDVSEDVLKDGHKMFEQGMPYPFDENKVIKTVWGYVPKDQSVVNGFDNNYSAREVQDIGLNGLTNEQEYVFYSDYISTVQGRVTDPVMLDKILKNPSGDNYVYYLDGKYNEEQATILDRYKDYNNPSGNSRPSEQTGGQNTMYTNYPDMEDINRDNTMNENENYYQYRIPLDPKNMEVGQNYIADKRVVEYTFKHNGRKDVTWYQFKIPLSEYQKTVGSISGFKSIRFMRLIMQGFADTTILRFGTFSLVRGEWRKYNYSLLAGQEGTNIPEQPNSLFDVSTVSIEENSQRTPVNYVMPPGVDRAQDPNLYEYRQMNEQAMQLKVVDLPDGDARAVYKNTIYDFRDYGTIQMDIHAEALSGQTLNNGDMSVFVRMGSDMSNNYYEYEVPLKVTAPGYYSDSERELVWPKDNMMNLPLSELRELKMQRNLIAKQTGSSMFAPYEMVVGNHTIRIVGNPNMGEVKSILVGVRNPLRKNNPADDGQSKSAVIWVNEFRLTDFTTSSGWAATARTSVKLADLGSVTLAGTYITDGFGSIDQTIGNRSREDVTQLDAVTNLELGKFFPEKIGVRLPFFFSVSERTANPLYDPTNQDLYFKDVLDYAQNKSERDSLKRLVQDYSMRRSIGFNNIRVAPAGRAPRVLDYANFSFSIGSDIQYQRNINIERRFQKNVRGALSYAYNVMPKYHEPFKKLGFLQGKAFTLIRDFNINLYPNQFSFTTDMVRNYMENQNKNIAYPDVKLPATFAKDFLWNRNYNLAWDLTQSLKFMYTAVNYARIDEPDGMVDKDRDREGYRHWRDSVWKGIRKFGRNVEFRQDFNFTWNVPLAKIPALNWVTSTTSYRGAFDWTAAPLMKDNPDYNYIPGNTIRNERRFDVNSTFNMMTLYNKVTFLKQMNDELAGKSRQRPPMVDVKYESPRLSFQSGRKRTITHKLKTVIVSVQVIDEKGVEHKSTAEVLNDNRVSVVTQADLRNVRVVVVGKVPKKDDIGKIALKSVARLAMMVKTVNINFNQTEGTTLPGFMGKTSMVGLGRMNGQLAPGFKFITGGQNEDFLEDFRRKGWLTTDTTMVSPFLMNKISMFNFRITLEPIKDLKIDLTGSRQHGTNKSIYNIVSGNYQYQMAGSFEISTISIGSAFENPKASNGYKSATYEEFKNIRRKIAWRMAADRQSVDGSYAPGGGEYPDGYGPLSQEVVIAAFESAYTGKSASSMKLRDFRKIPLPNWQIRYDGISKIKAIKGWVRSAQILHVYSSKYAVSGYSYNQLYDEQSDGLSYTRNVLGDFISKYDKLNVRIQENFNPLIGVDIGWQNDLSTKFEIRKERTEGLSLANSQVNEYLATTYQINIGYNFRNIPLVFQFGDRPSRGMKTTLRLTGGVGIQNDKTIVRRFDDSVEDNNQLYQGKRTVKIEAAADYTISDKINLRFFFDRNVNDPYVSAIGSKSTNVGISLRYIFAQ